MGLVGYWCGHQSQAVPSNVYWEEAHLPQPAAGTIASQLPELKVELQQRESYLIHRMSSCVSLVTSLTGSDSRREEEESSVILLWSPHRLKKKREAFTQIGDK